MALPIIRVYIRLQSVSISPPGWTIAGAFLWTVFFKVDGETVHLDKNTLKLQGKATVVPTPGNHGDLPGQSGSLVPIPKALGSWTTVLQPIPTLTGLDPAGGVIGCVAILLNQQDTPDSDIAAGHDTLNSSLQQQLDALIPQLGFGKTQVTPQDIAAIENNVKSAVENTVKDALGIGHKILTFLGFENQDSIITTAPFTYGQSSLVNVAAKGMPLQNEQSFTVYFLGPSYGDNPQSSSIATPGAYMNYDPESPPQDTTYNWIISGALYADPYPLSLARVFTELGSPVPASLRTAMRPYNTHSARIWAAEAG